MPAWFPAGDDSAAEEYYLKRARKFLGITDKKDVMWKWDDGATPGNKWERVVGSGGVVQVIGNRAGGVYNVVTGSNALSFFLAARAAGAGNYPAFLPTGANAKWYVATRIRMVTSPAADGAMGLFFRSPTGGVFRMNLGVEGAESVTKWAIKSIGGASVISDTNVDNGNFVVLEAYRKNNLTHLLINEVEEGTPADVFPAGIGGICMGGDGGTAVSAEGLFDWVAVMADSREAV
ncbi:hypothetical protein LCGC14_0375270 [marine sediment metagenome]|uniref:Uncharacterized protein n=1 Tax=marine sediment metagenome TaxID=412755 RepID=A0A0F9T414_9ZZZZ